VRALGASCSGAVVLVQMTVWIPPYQNRDLIINWCFLKRESFELYYLALGDLRGDGVGAGRERLLSSSESRISPSSALSVSIGSSETTSVIVNCIRNVPSTCVLGQKREIRSPGTRDTMRPCPIFVISDQQQNSIRPTRHNVFAV
jgi:hypothetical protein